MLLWTLSHSCYKVQHPKGTCIRVAQAIVLRQWFMSLFLLLVPIPKCSTNWNSSFLNQQATGDGPFTGHLTLMYQIYDLLSILNELRGLLVFILLTFIYSLSQGSQFYNTWDKQQSERSGVLQIISSNILSLKLNTLFRILHIFNDKIKICNNCSI
jgi:hypothetical protein